VRRNFPIPETASRDLSQGWYELVFATASAPGIFDPYESILQTDVQNGRVYAAIALTKAPTAAKDLGCIEHAVDFPAKVFKWSEWV
jgi:hypothetical protein